MSTTTQTVTANTMIRCSRCRRTSKIKRADDWNIVFSKGVVVGYLCGRCQTPEENAEAEINEATLDYSTMTTDAFGRATVKAKAADL